ncbi:hypothetical protein BJF90_26945 [Pseudonocardia sp. CNS-004]|nr:hypothetical protein BJF90_26945 [Pseudonocardia sp. CNS-004]
MRAVVTGAEALELVGPLPHGFDPAGAGGRTAVFRVLAVDEVRFVGDPVALVVGDTVAGAEAALDAIRVDYEVLPAVVELDQALADSAPRVFEDRADNVLMRVPYSAGDAEAALARSPMS